MRAAREAQALPAEEPGDGKALYAEGTLPALLLGGARTKRDSDEAATETPREEKKHKPAKRPVVAKADRPPPKTRSVCFGGGGRLKFVPLTAAFSGQSDKSKPSILML